MGRTALLLPALLLLPLAHSTASAQPRPGVPTLQLDVLITFDSASYYMSDCPGGRAQFRWSGQVPWRSTSQPPLQQDFEGEFDIPGGSLALGSMTCTRDYEGKKITSLNSRYAASPGTVHVQYSHDVLSGSETAGAYLWVRANVGQCQVRKFVESGGYETTTGPAFVGLEWIGGPDSDDPELRPKFAITEQEARQGFTKTFRGRSHSGDLLCERSHHRIIEQITITYSPDGSGPPKVALGGCSTIALGQSGDITADASPAGGRFKWNLDPASGLTLRPNGARATLAATRPGQASVDVEYTTPSGRTANANRSVACVDLKSVNAGQKVVIGLHDAKGNRLDGIRVVPITVLPAGGGDRLIFKPANPAVLTAVTAGDKLQLQGVAVGNTTVQAQTDCGQKVGAPLRVDVVPCDEQVIADLREQHQRAKLRAENVVKAITQLTADDEFDRASREGAQHIQDLAIKLIELAGKVGATGAVTGSSGEAAKAMKGIEDVYDVREVAELLDQALNEPYSEVSWKAAGMVADKILDKASGKVWGAAKAMGEAMELAAAVARDVGTVKGTADRIAELGPQQDEASRELLRIGELLFNRCRFGKLPPPSPLEPTATKPPPTKQPPARAPSKNSPPAGGQQPTAQPGAGEKAPPPQPPITDPAPPPTGPIGLPTDEQQRKCDGFAPVSEDADVTSAFRTLASNAAAIGQRAQAFQGITLQPLIQQTNATELIANDFIAAMKLPESERAAALAALRARKQAQPTAQLERYQADMARYGEGVSGCGTVLRDTFQAKLKQMQQKLES